MISMSSSAQGRFFNKAVCIGAALVLSVLLTAMQSCGKFSAKAPGSGSDSKLDSGQPAAGSPEAKAAEEAKAAAEATAAAKAQAEAASQANTLSPAEQAIVQAQEELKRIAALPVAAPVIKLASGVYLLPQTVSITAATKDAIIMYTVDGSAPSQKKGIKYTNPVSISATGEIRSVAYLSGGNTSEETRADYAIAELYVRQGGSGEGNRRNPLADIKTAIGKARTLGIKVIKISSGTYSGSVEITFPITLSGGWREDFGSRSSTPSIVKGSDAGTSTKPSPAYALKLSGTAVTAETKVENLDVRAGEASYSAAIFVSDGASPLLVNVRAVGGFGSYGYGAVVFSNANPTFRSCTLSGGEGASSYGLSVDSARAQVASSYLFAGSGSVGGYGLSATDARVSASSSVLAGSAANVSYGAAFYNSKSSSLENCTIVGGSGKEGVGVFISAGDPAVVNCIISAQGTAKSYGITDNYGDSAPSSLSGNVFIGCAGALYFDVDTKTAYTQCDSSGKLVSASGAVMAKPANSGNAVADFALQAPLFKTPPGALLPQAKVLTGNAAVDINGSPRTSPWTVGAYEL